MADKPAWLYRQSSVVPFLQDEEGLKVVLISSNSSGHWIFPKGVIERDMTPGESAANEALEEAGVVGKVSEEMIAEYEYEKWGGVCHVQVFALEISEVLESWMEMNQRERKIAEVAEAKGLVKTALEGVFESFIQWYATHMTD
jgi:8-oxo-dGTP pyrophosphatase MutT (NUDIX family)